MEHKLRLIDGRAVRALMPMDHCIGLMREAFACVSSGEAIQPIRQMVRTPDGAGMMGWMPGFTGEPKALGIKVISIFPGAVAQGIKSHQGVVLTFDPDNGRPLAMIDAAEITAIRTAAATAVATDLLARRDSRTLSIFGAGEQAITHLESLVRVRDFERVLVWGRDAAKAEAFVTEQAAHCPVPLATVATAEEAAAEGDVLCLVTGAPEPFFRGRWLKPGQHLNAVGSSIPSTAEVDAEAVARSRYFVDYRDSALLLAGEFKRAREAGVVGENHLIGEVGEVILGRVEGRRSDEDITMFKSLGMAAEDLVSAAFILSEAERSGAGLSVDW